MINPALEELLDKKRNPNIKSKFEMITMISKRAKQINNGASLMIETTSKKPVSIAMWEIYESKIIPIKKEQKRRG